MRDLIKNKGGKGVPGLLKMSGEWLENKGREISLIGQKKFSQQQKDKLTNQAFQTNK